MKIAIASSGLGHVARGVEAWAADLGHALAERGVNVTVCKGGGRAEAAHERVIGCWERGAEKTQRLVNWLPRRLTWRLGLGSGYGVEQTTFGLRLIEYLRREDVDLLHVQDPQVALMVQRAREFGLLRTRTILAHGTEESAEFLRKISYLQHLAPWHLEEARRAGVWKEAWRAIPNFIDTERFRPGRAEALREELGIPADGHVLLSVAAIKRTHKRVDYLLAEFERLRRDCPAMPVWLVVAGGLEGETGELVEEGRKRLGDRAKFLVRFPRERMAELYRAADLFALCSLKEMMPIAVLEAIASGLPCVMNRHPVLEWMSGAGGEAIEMETPGVLARAVGRLFENEARRRAMAENGRRHCMANFSTDRVVDAVLDYYQFVMSDGCAGANLRKAG